MATLVIMRHGESVWTDKAVNRFAGWVDIPLTDRGRVQAHHAGLLLREAGIEPVECMTSVLGRSIETARIVLDDIDRAWLPVGRTWRLNERHYGAFQGQTRPAMRERYGEEAFNLYRRSYDVRPPEIDRTSEFYQADDPRYGIDFADGLDELDPATIRSESLADLRKRLHPWWEAHVLPVLAKDRCVLIVTHGSVVRSIRMALEDISPEAIRSVNVPTGVPLAYHFAVGKDGIPRVSGEGHYLDEAAARIGIKATSELGTA
ncbi:2,3-bisphosphoglycerate-dependent phosphoglycerate mutase [Olsenella uli]|uniref:2,3-bisphosphoglycerate-dependent phosphoglycerate mutase n=1 Tax=Olsenella uli TaxID=133926 RepID=UPI0012ABC248|nr:2,3-bisphosphoglycerate-dependent phosphoglycerate mutase [Olsenella uli]